MKQIIICLTDEQMEDFEAAIEELRPVAGHDTPEKIANALIEDFCRNMGVGWKFGKADIEDQEGQQ